MNQWTLCKKEKTDFILAVGLGDARRVERIDRRLRPHRAAVEYYVILSHDLLLARL